MAGIFLETLGLFRYCSVHESRADGIDRGLSTITVQTVRKMCARNTARMPLRASWQGRSAPVASPGQVFQPVDPTERPSASGHQTRGPSCPRGPQTRGRLPLSLVDSHRPGVRRHGPARRASPPLAPCPRRPRHVSVCGCKLGLNAIRSIMSLRGCAHGAAQRQREQEA